MYPLSDEGSNQFSNLIRRQGATSGGANFEPQASQQGKGFGGYQPTGKGPGGWQAGPLGSSGLPLPGGGGNQPGGHLQGGYGGSLPPDEGGGPNRAMPIGPVGWRRGGFGGGEAGTFGPGEFQGMPIPNGGPGSGRGPRLGGGNFLTQDTPTGPFNPMPHYPWPKDRSGWPMPADQPGGGNPMPIPGGGPNWRGGIGEVGTFGPGEFQGMPRPVDPWRQPGGGSPGPAGWRWGNSRG